MDRLAQELEEVRDRIEPRWDEERSARLYAGVGQLRRRRAAARVGMGAGAVTVAALALVVLGGRPGGGPLVAVQSAPAGRAPATTDATAVAPGDTIGGGHRVRLADGSTSSLVGQQSELEIMHNTPMRVAMRLLRGQAHFDVVPNRERSFTVEVGSYQVVVLGTVFDVQRSAEEVRVHVSRGKVRVYGPQGAHDVPAGDTLRLSLEIAEPAAALPVELPSMEEVEAPAARPKARRGVRKAADKQPEWRSLSQGGDYEAAFASLQRGVKVENDPAALMDAADAARLSGHPRSAVQYLDRVIGGHRQSPVAPLAAFTLGRVYLDRLGEPHRAAEVFALARALSPHGSLAQDALAREVEALSKGGDSHRAYTRAQEYLRLYPRGRRVRAVQLYGGLTQ